VSRFSLLILSVLFVAPAALGQRPAGDDPRREALAKALRPVTAELDEAALEDVFAYLEQATGAAYDVVWADESASGVGLDRDETVTLTAREQSGLTFLERVLERASDPFDAATWQVTREGLIEVGPRSALNRRGYVKVYDVRDLLFEIPDFTDVPDLELGSIVQGQGGAESDAEIEVPDAADERERMDRLIEIIQTTVEFEQWRDNGGDAADITPFRGSLLIRAPGYIHRQLGGYEFWPSAAEVERAGP